jgi:hypothetical protein
MFNGGSVLSDGTIVADNGPRWGKVVRRRVESHVATGVDRPAGGLSDGSRPMPDVVHLPSGHGGGELHQCGVDLHLERHADHSHGHPHGVGAAYDRRRRHDQRRRVYYGGLAVSPEPSAGECLCQVPHWVQHLRTSGSTSSSPRASPTGATDDFSTSFGCGMRYSTAAADPGFVSWWADGTNQLTGSTAISGGCRVNRVLHAHGAGEPRRSRTACPSVGVNGVSADGSRLPSTALNRAVIVALVIKSTDAAATKFIDFSSMFAETQVVRVIGISAQKCHNRVTRP